METKQSLIQLIINDHPSNDKGYLLKEAFVSKSAPIKKPKVSNDWTQLIINDHVSNGKGYLLHPNNNSIVSKRNKRRIGEIYYTEKGACVDLC